MRRFALCSFVAFVLLNGCRKDVSGSYLASDKGAVCWLQLVRTPDGHLSGQIVSSVLKPDGEIEHSSESLTGAANGENVTLTGGGFLGMAATTLSGTFNGEALTLLGVQSTPVSLKRATLEEFQARLAEQTTQSQAIVSAHNMAARRQETVQALRNFVAEVDQLTVRIHQFDAEADVHLGRFSNAEKGYEAITSKVNEDVAQERQLVGSPNRRIDRSQLYVAATQASLQTDQLHLEGQALRSSLETNIAPLVSEVTNLEKGCSQVGSEGAILTQPEIDARQKACNRLLTLAPTLHQKYFSLASGLDHLEEVYRREKEAEERLLTMARKME